MRAERRGDDPQPRVSSSQKRKQKKLESAEQAATVIIIILDGLVQSSFGIECAMNDHETKMIIPPLTRIMQRLDNKTMKMVERYSDPILLAMGMAAWLGRIYRIQSEGRDDDDRLDDDIEPIEPGPNGRTVEDVLTEDGDSVGAFNHPVVEEIGGGEGLGIG